jgi:hypothetical protein
MGGLSAAPRQMTAKQQMCAMMPVFSTMLVQNNSLILLK